MGKISFSKVLLLFMGFLSSQVFAQFPPSHDPSTMIRNVDGRYWIFTTGNGVWAMSSSNADFTNWQAESTPFPNGTYPSWISNYVTGFTGFFWAPDVIKIGNTYYLYYSCAGQGAPAAIGVATATNLSGPWTDQGMVVAGNNAIDPALILDNGRLWMTWGNWQTGIDICELSSSTGKRISGITHLVSGQVEGPGIYKNGSYYYLFYQRGLCCNGVNSTYYMVVARSSSITGPYTDERVFLPNQNGQVIGPGHFGYGEGRLTYHFYDAYDNGNAKLMVRTDFGFANGWPYVGNPPAPLISGHTYRIVPRMADLKGVEVYNFGTANGSNVSQWEYWGGATQKWIATNVGSGYWRFSPATAPSRAMDVYNVSTANGANVNIWDYWGGYGQQWAINSTGDGWYTVVSRNSGKCLDVEGFSTANGGNLVQWECLNGYNQHFRFEEVPAAARPAGENEEIVVKNVKSNTENLEIKVYPNPFADILHIDSGSNSGEANSIKLINTLGQTVFETSFTTKTFELNLSSLQRGIYMLSVNTASGVTTKKIKKN